MLQLALPGGFVAEYLLKMRPLSSKEGLRVIFYRR